MKRQFPIIVLLTFVSLTIYKPVQAQQRATVIHLKHRATISKAIMVESTPTPSPTPMDTTKAKEIFLQWLSQYPIFEGKGDTTKASVLYDLHAVMERMKKYPPIQKQQAVSLLPQGTDGMEFKVNGEGNIERPKPIVTPGFEGPVTEVFFSSRAYMQQVETQNGWEVRNVEPANSFVIKGKINYNKKHGMIEVYYPAFGITSIHPYAGPDEKIWITTRILGDDPGSVCFCEKVSSDKYGDYDEGIKLTYHSYQLREVKQVRTVPLKNTDEWSKETGIQPGDKSQAKSASAFDVGPALAWDEYYRDITNSSSPSRDLTEEYLAYWFNGKIKAQGHYKNGGYIGAWNLYYPTGNQLAEFQYDAKGKCQSVKAWHEDGSKLCESFPWSADDSSDESLSLTYWDKKGTIVSKNCRYETDTELYWPNGQCAYKYHDDHTDGSSSTKYYDFTGKQFCEVGVSAMVGSWGTEHRELSVLDPVAGNWEMKNVPDGNYKIGTWNIFGVLPKQFNGEKLDIIDVLFAVQLVGGKLEGEFHCGEADFQFVDGLLDGPETLSDRHYVYRKGKLLKKALYDENR